MKNAFFIKVLTIGIIIGGLLVILSMIEGSVAERERYRNSVVEDIASATSGNQRVTGPILVFPYTIKIKKEKSKDFDHVKKAAYFLPEKLNIDTKVDTQERYRGLYKVPVYTSHLAMTGNFKIQINSNEIENFESWGVPFVILNVSDMRGIDANTSIKINGNEEHFLPGNNDASLHSGDDGIYATTKHINPASVKTALFDISVNLQGTKKLSFLPIGELTIVKMSSAWKTPSFTGRFLPKSRDVSDKGFSATWETTFLSTNMLQAMHDCVEDNTCSDFQGKGLGVIFKEAVDIYSQTERAVKYAVLFIALTFVAFFLTEILQKLQLHPIQYGLAGLDLAIFYLLLLALSEYIPFHFAYLIAGFGSIALFSFYVSHILNSLRNGMLFGGMLTMLYGALYVLISSEEYSFLMGSCLMFLILASIMYITRKMDWYAATEPLKKSAKTLHQNS